MYTMSRKYWSSLDMVPALLRLAFMETDFDGTVEEAWRWDAGREAAG